MTLDFAENAGYSPSSSGIVFHRKETATPNASGSRVKSRGLNRGSLTTPNLPPRGHFRYLLGLYKPARAELARVGKSPHTYIS